MYAHQENVFLWIMTICALHRQKLFVSHSYFWSRSEMSKVRLTGTFHMTRGFPFRLCCTVCGPTKLDLRFCVGETAGSFCSRRFPLYLMWRGRIWIQTVKDKRLRFEPNTKNLRHTDVNPTATNVWGSAGPWTLSHDQILAFFENYFRPLWSKEKNAMNLRQWFQPGGRNPREVDCHFSEVAKASDKNIHNYSTSRFHISYSESLFVVTKVIGSTCKNDCQIFHLKLF